MACYNGSRFISRSFESILAQTWPNIELVFVDDGSTDDSKDVAMKYSERFARKGFELKILSQQNQGFCAAAANAAKIATGKYLQILDVDDFIMPESCRLQAEFLERHDEINVVRTNGFVVHEEHPEIKQPLERNAKSYIHRNIFMDLIAGTINNWAGAYMVRADKHKYFYSTHTFPISRYGQNLQFLLPQTIDAPSGFIDLPLFKYYRYIGSHSNQASYEKQMENLNGYWDIRRTMLKLLGVNDSDILAVCEKAYLKRAIAIAYDFKMENDYRQFYSKLKNLKGLTLELKIQDSIHNGSLVQYWYRICLKFKKLLKNND